MILKERNPPVKKREEEKSGSGRTKILLFVYKDIRVNLSKLFLVEMIIDYTILYFT